MGKSLAIGLVSLLWRILVFGQTDTSNVKNTASGYSTANEHMYNWKKGIDRPVTYVGTLWSLYAFTKIYSKSPSSVQQIQDLNRNDINSFDRPGIDVYKESAVQTSNILFYGSMPLPLLLLLDKKIRSDVGRVASVYAEALAVTGLIYTGSVYFVDKYRPLAYNPNVPMDTRTRGGAKNSFFAGHVALVGTSTFFIAKVYSDYHPHSGTNWVLYGGAIASTAITAYYRYEGGQHFLSDIFIGEAVGIFSGILIPSFHKNKTFNNSRLSILPFAGKSDGIALIYHLNKIKNK